VGKRTKHIAPKSTNKPRVHYSSEPKQGSFCLTSTVIRFLWLLQVRRRLPAVNCVVLWSRCSSCHPANTAQAMTGNNNMFFRRTSSVSMPHCHGYATATKADLLWSSSMQFCLQFIDWVQVFCPIRHKKGHFRNVLPSQSLGVVLKKLNLTQQK